jgi:MFS family permease
MLGLLALCALLLGAYWFNARGNAHPLLRLQLFSIRTFRTAVGGSFVTRLGIGGMAFLLPLLYQVGFGFSAVRSGLLIMPQTVAAISLKLAMPRILKRFGYRRVLVANTLMLGLIIVTMSLLTQGTPVALIVALVFLFGFIQSLQFTSMNTLAFADVDEEDASGASTISSTLQLMSVGFSVATASLVVGLFIPDRFHADSATMVRGLHQAFWVLGAWTMASTLVFAALRQDDGSSVSRHRAGG